MSDSLRAAAGRASRLERLLPLACVVAAGVLVASELMIAFEFTPPGAEPLAEQSSADRHHYAPVVLAAFAVISLVIAIALGSKPWAYAVAACGVIALLIFLIGDLPDANAVGTLDDPRQSFFDAEAVPQAGFWLELIGALGLAVSGAAVATLTPEQLTALRPLPRERRPRRRGPQPARGEQILTDAERYGEEVRDGPPAEEKPATARHRR